MGVICNYEDIIWRMGIYFMTIVDGKYLIVKGCSCRKRGDIENVLNC